MRCAIELHNFRGYFWSVAIGTNDFILHAHKFMAASEDIKRPRLFRTIKMCEIYGISVPTTVHLMLILCMKFPIALKTCTTRLTKHSRHSQASSLIIFKATHSMPAEFRKRPETFYRHSSDSEEAASTFFNKIYERNVSEQRCVLLCELFRRRRETELMFN